MLSVNNSMTSVDLSSNQIAGREGEPGVKAIADAISQSTSLVAINLSNNDMDQECAELLATALNVSSSMTSVDLSSNQIVTKIESGYIKGKSWAKGEEVEHEGFTWTCTNVYADGDRKLTRNDITGVKAIADALSVSSSMNALK